MTYNVFGGTLNLTQSSNLQQAWSDQMFCVIENAVERYVEHTGSRGHRSRGSRKSQSNLRAHSLKSAKRDVGLCEECLLLNIIIKCEILWALRSDKNSNVLSFCLNTRKDRSGRRSPGGRSFHAQTPVDEMLLSPNLLRVRGATITYGLRKSLELDRCMQCTCLHPTAADVCWLLIVYW